MFTAWSEIKYVVIKAIVHQLWARYLKEDNISTKIGSGRDRDWGGLPDFLTNRDRDRGGLPDFLTNRDRDRGGLPDPPRLYQPWARYLEGDNISTKIGSGWVEIKIGEASPIF